ncbi:MAG: hypothetical protein WDO74_29495 [Pseudomonadota bacterium]
MHRRKAAQIARSFAALSSAALGIAACSSEPATSNSAGGRAGSVEGGTAGGGGSVAAPPASGGGGAGSGAGDAASGGGGGAASGGGSAASAGAGRGGNSAGGGGANNAGGPGPSGCTGRDLLLCEDFENTDLGEVPSGWTRHGDLAAVDGADAHGGARSLRLGPTANAERRIYHDAKLLGRAHWGRIYFKVQTPVPDAFVHSTLVSLIGNGPKNGRSDYRPIDTVKQAKDTRDVGGRNNFIYNVQIIGKSEFGTETSYDYTFDAKWHCAEYHIDAADQSYTLYFDGKDVLHFRRGAGNLDDSDIPNEFDELRIGWINYQSAPPGFTAFIDDIAFDDTRIGCD